MDRQSARPASSLDRGHPQHIQDPRSALRRALGSTEVAMPAKSQTANDQIYPVAILDKELRKTNSFRIEIFELCSLCGARFGIGYFGASREGLKHEPVSEDLPQKLVELLAQDHRRQREHKGFIELDF